MSEDEWPALVRTLFRRPCRVVATGRCTMVTDEEDEEEARWTVVESRRCGTETVTGATLEPHSFRTSCSTMEIWRERNELAQRMAGPVQSYHV